MTLGYAFKGNDVMTRMILVDLNTWKAFEQFTESNRKLLKKKRRCYLENSDSMIEGVFFVLEEVKTVSREGILTTSIRRRLQKSVDVALY